MKIDTRTATWAVLKQHVTTRIDELRANLESNLSFDDTVRARAQLKELRGILALAEKPEEPLIEADFELPL